MQGSLFAQSNEGTQYRPTVEIVEAENFTNPYLLVSLAQFKILQSNPYSFFFKGKTIEEIETIEKKKGTEMYRKSHKSVEAQRQLDEWREAYWANLTLVLENEYLKVDRKLCLKQTGAFYLLGADGGKTEVRYSFDPNYFGTANSRTTPVPHFEFRTEDATGISETSYRSHFMTFIPSGAISSFGELIVLIMRGLKVQSAIECDGIFYPYEPLIEKSKAKSEHKKNRIVCPECGEADDFTTDGGCDVCGYFPDTPDEENFCHEETFEVTEIEEEISQSEKDFYGLFLKQAA